MTEGWVVAIVAITLGSVALLAWLTWLGCTASDAKMEARGVLTMTKAHRDHILAAAAERGALERRVKALEDSQDNRKGK